MKNWFLLLLPIYVGALRGSGLIDRHHKSRADDGLHLVSFPDGRSTMETKIRSPPLRRSKGGLSMVQFIQEIHSNQAIAEESGRQLYLSQDEISSCFYAGDGCTCESNVESGWITWSCPDVCGKDRTFTGEMVVSYHQSGSSHSVPINHRACTMQGCNGIEQVDCLQFGTEWQCDDVCTVDSIAPESTASRSSSADDSTSEANPSPIEANTSNDVNSATTNAAEQEQSETIGGGRSLSVGGIAAIITLLLFIFAGCCVYLGGYCRKRRYVDVDTPTGEGTSPPLEQLKAEPESSEEVDSWDADTVPEQTMTRSGDMEVGSI